MAKRNHRLNCAPDRRLYDINLCEATTHWAALRTGLDGPQYGNWACPSSWTLFSYADHNSERLDCESPDEFKELVRAARRPARRRVAGDRPADSGAARPLRPGRPRAPVGRGHGPRRRAGLTTHRPGAAPPAGVRPHTLTASSEHFPEGVEPLGKAFQPRPRPGPRAGRTHRTGKTEPGTTVTATDPKPFRAPCHFHPANRSRCSSATTERPRVQGQVASSRRRSLSLSLDAPTSCGRVR